jgi:hypothetical protein
MNFIAANKWIYGGSLSNDEIKSGFLNSVIGEYHSPTHNILNMENQRSGIHLLHHQIFNTNGLAVILYCRNSFDQKSNALKGTVSCLKFIGTKSLPAGGYASAKNENDKHNRISLEVGLGDVVDLYQVLCGSSTSFKYDVIKSNTPKKTLRLRVTSNGFFISMTSNPLHLDINISAADCLAIQAISIALYKIKYPFISDVVIHEMLAGRKKFEHDSSIDAIQKTDEPLQDNDDIFGFNEKPISEMQKKALWAIGKNKWPTRCEATVQTMQKKIGTLAADKIVKAANKGDFTLFDEAKRRISINQF